ncbi:MAG: hypothetical protein LKM38_10090 [Pseudomonas veronii]|jgi:flagellar hook-length control protein FliK|nr:hypothetical protein [Pseudomonas veronii]
MDILASLAPSTAAPAPASLPAEATVAPSESFAAVLSQVDVPVADPLPVVQSAPAPTLAPALAAADTAPVMPEPAAAALPTPVVAAPVPLAEPEPVAVDEVPNAWPDQPVTAVEEPELTTKGDSSLDDIRQRMALIESAGQLDTAAMIVAPPTPVSVPLPVVVSAESAEPAPLISSRAPAQATSLPAADDEADTPQPIDLPDAMPTLVASVADSVPSVRAQTHDSQAQSQPDPQSVFSLSAASFSPTNLAVADTVASNSLVLTAAIGSADWQTDPGPADGRHGHAWRAASGLAPAPGRTRPVVHQPQPE